MMPFNEAIVELLAQIHKVLIPLTHEQFSRPITILTGSTIGQHTRHILEFYIELQKGYNCGIVDYDRRQRDHSIETDKDIALNCLLQVTGGLARPDRKLLLRANYGEDADGAATVDTNYGRELIYNLEHTVHHMAMIRIGVQAVSTVDIPAGFGIAEATLKYRQICAQ